MNTYGILCQCECKQWQNDGDDIVVVAPSIADINSESTFPRPAVVPLSAGSKHGPPIECKRLIRDDVVETGLCRHNSF